MKKWLKYFNEIRGVECQCGNFKRSKQTFCRSCYSKLPINMQNDLFKTIGDGYEEAYDQAVTFLKK